MTSGFRDCRAGQAIVGPCLSRTPAPRQGSTLTAAINDAGVVAGEYFDASAVVHGFAEQHGVFTPVEDPAGTEGTDLTGISNLGVVVGFYLDGTHGFELSPTR
jgi:hypothetical protein